LAKGNADNLGGVNPEELARAILAAIASHIASSAGALGLESAALPEHLPLERPKNRDHGDYASSIALQLAKAAGRNPRELASNFSSSDRCPSWDIRKLILPDLVFSTSPLPKGHKRRSFARCLPKVALLAKGARLLVAPLTWNLLAPNPTGPLHLGHTRWAAVGDAIARVLIAAGAKVTREFYINDRGTQMDLFAASLHAAAHGLPTPENGYHGGYIADLAQAIIATTSCNHG